MKVALVALALVLGVGLAACHQGHGLGGPDFAAPPDLEPPADLEPAPDLVPPPNCGKIIFCAFQCGTTNLTCLPGCFQNASPMAVQEAGALIACAAQSCLAGDGGAGGMFQIFQCLQTNCLMQLAGCQGLGIGG